MPETKNDHNILVQQSVSSLPQQIADGLAQWPKSLMKKTRYKHLIISGMGGSALAGDIIRYALWDSLPVQISIVNNYTLPAYSNKETLAVIISYSGDTEEEIACFHQALKAGLPMVVMTTGGALAMLARKHRVPLWQFDTGFNVSNQPRYGLGYLLSGVTSLISDISNKPAIKKNLSAATVAAETHWPSIRAQAKKMGWRPTLLVASEHLLGAAHAAANQLNESAKLFAVAMALPELNHHLLESLSSLPKNSWNVLFYQSDRYHNRIQKRYQLTKGIMKDTGLRLHEKTFSGSSIEQVVSAVAFSSALSLELGRLAGFDAMSIPYVEGLKKQLH